ncbi:exodeoxyribonuclease VII large subunit [Paucilactobacillus nenjiangensis]|uniref:exodeoxyribonuclease VII large subunit n=1 Tax=Paucilactobacillus nenjiangensis TaxID=1296540 RepID=UPI003BB59C4C
MENSDQYLTVTALTKYIKRKFDVDPYLGRIYLTGELSNFRLRPNAHQYFSLKDDHAKISAIMFKSAFEKVKFTPEEGMKVLVTGRISLYEASGSYQIYVDSMQPDGIGALYQAYEQLKKKLTDEGLFDLPKKRLPMFPKRIAVVTSPSGAVIRDIITTVQRRFPIAQIVLFPALVQGDKAAADIVKQIEHANEIGNFDTLIIGRGGGSIEDLWPFNEEIVARAIVDSQLPVISSVGHETDTTIADLVADVRAATPTAAAELAVPVLNDELLKINQYRQRLFQAMNQTIKIDQQKVAKVRESYIFTQPTRLYERYIQNVDLAKNRLEQLKDGYEQNWQQKVDLLTNRLSGRNIQQSIANQQQQLANLEVRINQASRTIINNQRQSTAKLIAQLDNLSPLKIMSRGYSYVTLDKKVVKSVTQLTPNKTIKMNFEDGSASAEIKEINKE